VAKRRRKKKEKKEKINILAPTISSLLFSNLKQDFKTEGANLFVGTIQIPRVHKLLHFIASADPKSGSKCPVLRG